MTCSSRGGLAARCRPVRRRRSRRSGRRSGRSRGGPVRLVQRRGQLDPVVERAGVTPRRVWPVSWPLPAISTTSPGRAQATAWSIAVAAVGDLDHLGGAPASAAPARISRPDGRGVLAAGVVVGDDHQVGQLGGDAAHRCALARVAIAAGAEHDRQPAARARARVAAPRATRPACARSRPARGSPGRGRSPRAVRGPASAAARRGLLRRDPDRVQNRERDKAIRDVIVARQPDPDPVVHTGGIDRGELLSPGADRRHVHGAPVGGPIRVR